MNWNPFNTDKEDAAVKASEEAIKRADKLEERLTALLDEKEEEQRQINEAIEEANKTATLIAEEKERKEAEKTMATEKGEPWINIVSIEMEPDNGANVGAIEMDWNEHFIKMLQQNGYVGVNDDDAVDQWFRDVCKHVVLETYEDEEADDRVTRTGLEDGRAEYT